MVNPLSIGKTFPVNSFDELIFFLPGLSFSVPKELGTADRPLFAYRVHHFVFQLLRSAKCLLKGEGQLHVVWPEETSLMSSPCGAAGIEMMQLLNHLGCKPEAAKYSMENIKAECIKPIIFGSFYNTELPEWLQSLQISSFQQIDMKPISLPLSVALQLHPWFGVGIHQGRRDRCWHGSTGRNGTFATEVDLRGDRSEGAIEGDL